MYTLFRTRNLLPDEELIEPLVAQPVPYEVRLHSNSIAPAACSDRIPRLEGLSVVDMDGKYSKEFYEVVPKMLADGKLRYLEHVYHGLENAGQGIVDFFTGGNIGKSVVVLSED